MRRGAAYRRGLARQAAVAGGATFLVASLGSLATDLGPWYRGLRFPPWQPPDWAFPVAWTLVFTLTAIAAVLAWRGAAGDGAARRRLLWLYGANAALNIGWSVIFFRLRRPDWALLEAGVFWASILALMLASARHSRAAAWLLLPYLLWVGFATALNAAVLRLNPG
jgi:tryptophan-rich sensory protein